MNVNALNIENNNNKIVLIEKGYLLVNIKAFTNNGVYL